MFGKKKAEKNDFEILRNNALAYINLQINTMDKSSWADTVYGMMLLASALDLITFEERQEFRAKSQKKFNELLEKEKLEKQKAKEDKARIIAEYEAARKEKAKAAKAKMAEGKK